MRNNLLRLDMPQPPSLVLQFVHTGARMSEHFDVYMKAVGQALAQGQATEHTYRPALKALLEAHAPAVTATNEPKRVACGAPDFVIETGRSTTGSSWATPKPKTWARI